MEFETDQAVWVRMGEGGGRPAKYLGPGDPTEGVARTIGGEKEGWADVARVEYEDDGSPDSLVRSRLTSRD